MAKLYATETAQFVVDAAVQILGARALVAGHPLEHLYREVRAPRIYEGTSEIQRTIIARASLRPGRRGAVTARIVVVPGPGLDEGGVHRMGSGSGRRRGGAARRPGRRPRRAGQRPSVDEPPVPGNGAEPPLAGVIIAPGPAGLDAGGLAAAVAATGVPVVAVEPGNLRKAVPSRNRPASWPPGRRCSTAGARHRPSCRAVPGPPSRPAPDTLAYGPEPSQEGDLWVPAGAGPHPVAVLFHGGFWYHAWERDLMDGLALDLARRGIAAWNVEYRRVGAGGGWPVTGEDADRATEHLLALAPVYGLDLGRVAVLGHSAGAQLALWVAARGRRAAVHPALAVGLATIADLGPGPPGPGGAPSPPADGRSTARRRRDPRPPWPTRRRGPACRSGFRRSWPTPSTTGWCPSPRRPGTPRRPGRPATTSPSSSSTPAATSI